MNKPLRPGRTAPLIPQAEPKARFRLLPFLLWLTFGLTLFLLSYAFAS